MDMCVNARHCLPGPRHNRTIRPAPRIVRGMFLLALAVAPAALRSQQASESPLGIAWNVRGTWRTPAAPAPLRTGDAIQPGSLLLPNPSASDHSITIFLLDGQSVLYECFTAKDCARGFRVPALYHAPAPFATEMLGRIRAVLVQQQRGQTAAAQATEPQIARDEAVAVLGQGNRIEIGGQAAALSNGEYFGDLRSIGARYPERLGIPLKKSGPSIALTVPGPGLYLLTIADSMKRPRIDFMIAVERAQGSRVSKDFQEAHALLTEWCDDFFGWPMHDFERAYLQSLMLGIRPLLGSSRETPSTDSPLPGVTAEPTFTPRPGMLAGDIAVTVRCATPGAVIHYTVDSSQPFENSPVYRAPVIMKRIGLTIKAFAQSPGKKDSAVVTGNFRIEQ